MDAVLACHVMTGSADCLLRVRAERLDDDKRFVRTRLHAVPGIALLGTSFARRMEALRARRAARRAWPVVYAAPGAFRTGEVSMDVDEGRIDEAVLALLWLTLHDGARAWKGHDWDALDRLHRKGFIFDPVNKAKSVVLTEKGLREAERLFEAMFARRPS